MIVQKKFLLLGLLLLQTSVCFSEETPIDVPIHAPIEAVIETKCEFEAQGGYTLEVDNLMGTLVVEAGTENKIEVVAQVYATAKDAARAKELAEKVRIVANSVDKKVTVFAEYPLGAHSIYYYPMKNEGKKKGPHKGKSRLQYHGKDVMVLSDSSPAAISLHVSIHIKVPPQVTLVLKNYFGEMVTKGVQADLTLETVAASMQVVEGQGKVMVSSGSGTLDLMKHDGDVCGYTGSGDSTLVACSGNCALEAGASAISLKECTLDRVSIRSGSGSIVLKATTANLTATTGSGKVVVEDFVGKKLFKIETGSGSVKVKGDFSQLEELYIQSGSGNVTFVSTPFPKLAFDVTTGNGRITVTVPGFKTKQSSARAVKFGEGNVAFIRTGSGNVCIETARTKKKTASLQEEKR